MFIAASTAIASDDTCGAQSLSVCCARLGVEIESAELERMAGSKGIETSLLDLSNCATKLDLATIGLDWVPGTKPTLLWNAPGIARIFIGTERQPHFVALVGAEGDKLLLVDYPHPPIWMSDKKMRESMGWNGSILHVALDKDTLLKATQGKISLTHWSLGLAIAILISLAVYFQRRQLKPAKSRRKEMTTPIRQGFTVIELLVCIMVASLLLSLLLPAVQRARAAAARTECTSRLKQIGVACHAFEATHRRFPKSDPASWQSKGVARPSVSAHTELLSWIDQGSVDDLVDKSDQGGSGIDNEPPTSDSNSAVLETVIKAYQCPWDNAPNPHFNYRISFGTSPLYHETRPIGPNAALRGFSGNRPSKITDGLSHTAAFAEKLAGDQNPDALTPWRDSVQSVGADWKTPEDVRRSCSLPIDPLSPHHSYGGYAWVISGVSSGGYNHILTPNSKTPDCTGGPPENVGAFTARSLHTGGVNVLLADGAVRFIAQEIDQSTWHALGTANGAEPSVSDF